MHPDQCTSNTSFHVRANVHKLLIVELGRMLKCVFEYSFYIYDKYSLIRGMKYHLLWLIYVYNGVVQTLWFVYADKTKVYSKRMRLVPAEPSTICGGSNSSACNLKALICWQ